MSAEGKFFHRSCFRCDYCNILLRLGSYVYHRDDGTPFSGKFFCIPHSTENALEKYRYRKKADEIKDAENRKYSELLHQTTQDWSSPSYINRHKDRLNLRRGGTPERAEFEASLGNFDLCDFTRKKKLTRNFLSRSGFTTYKYNG